MTETPLCPECGSERTDFTKVCPACGAPPAPEHRVGEGPGDVRGHDLEPYVTLRYIAKLFKVLAVLIMVMLVGEIVTGLLIDGTSAAVTLLGEGTRLVVMAGLLWAGGDLALLMIDAGHDLRVARILLGRINAQMHRTEPGPGLMPGDASRTVGAGAGASTGAARGAGTPGR